MHQNIRYFTLNSFLTKLTFYEKQFIQSKFVHSKTKDRTILTCHNLDWGNMIATNKSWQVASMKILGLNAD